MTRTTGGADYLGGSGGTGFSGGGNDFTLLQMRNNPPVLNAYPALDEEVTLVPVELDLLRRQHLAHRPLPGRATRAYPNPIA